MQVKIYVHCAGESHKLQRQVQNTVYKQEICGNLLNEKCFKSDYLNPQCPRLQLLQPLDYQVIFCQTFESLKLIFVQPTLLKFIQPHSEFSSLCYCHPNIHQIETPLTLENHLKSFRKLNGPATVYFIFLKHDRRNCCILFLFLFVLIYIIYSVELLFLNMITFLWERLNKFLLSYQNKHLPNSSKSVSSVSLLCFEPM